MLIDAGKIENARNDQERFWSRIAIGYILFTMAGFSALVIGGSIYSMHLRRWAVERGALRALALLKESEWGLGQIIAPFTWAPLIIDLALCIIYAHGKETLPGRECGEDCETCKRLGRTVPTMGMEGVRDVEEVQRSK